MFSKRLRTAACMFAAAILIVAGVPVAAPSFAYADGGDTGAELSELQQRVEDTANAYDKASSKVEKLNVRIEKNDARIQEIDEQLPECREKAASAMSAMYKMQNQTTGLIDLVLGAESLSDAIRTIEYLNGIQEQNAAALEELSEMEAELQERSEQLAGDKKKAKKQQAKAESAMEEAIAVREEAQQKAEEEAAAEEAAAEEAAAEEAAEEAESKKSGSSSSKKASSEKSSSTKTTSSNESSNTEALVGGQVNWSIGRSDFISAWTKRINDYLAGSALAGQGEAFATAAWNYGVDPRWSPAIAYTESSLGANCFKPYNAWGWGSSSWSNWESAIYDHVAGLARGYGSTISISAAQKYCPSNWHHWYNATVAQMNLI